MYFAIPVSPDARDYAYGRNNKKLTVLRHLQFLHLLSEGGSVSLNLLLASSRADAVKQKN